MRKISLTVLAALLMTLSVASVVSAAGPPSGGSLPGNQSAEFSHPGEVTQCESTDPTGAPVPSVLGDAWTAECGWTTDGSDKGEDNNPATGDVTAPDQAAD